MDNFKTRSNMSNETISPVEELCIRNPIYQNSMIVLFILTVSLSIVENILLWAAYIVNKNLRTHANAYIISLSVSDTITSLTIGWLETYYVWAYPYWVFREKGTMVQNSFWCLSLVTPFMHIILISVDRYRAVTYPTDYRQNNSWKNVMLKIMSIWVYCIFIVMLMAFHFTPAPGFQYQWNVTPAWYYPFLGVHTVIPLGICSVLYFCILKTIIRSKKRITQNQDVIGREERKYTRTIGCIILLLYTVWIPVVIMEIIYAILAHSCVVAQIGTISVWLTCTSGVINPLVFLSKNKTFRITIFSYILRFKSIRKIQRNTSVMMLRVRAETMTSDFVNSSFSNVATDKKELPNPSHSSYA